jgi:Ca-activated chloride channel homolog
MHSIAYTRSKPVTSHNRSDRRPACHPKTHEHRKGAILVIVAALIVMLATIGSMTIGIAQIQLVRAELRMATDAAAKAAVTTLGRTQSLSSARQTAREIAALHQVAGVPFQITDANIEFGSAVRQTNGTFSFTLNGNPINAARITANRTNGSPLGSVPLMFPGFLSATNFQAVQEATAARADHDICLVLDRSGSMAWDLTSKKFSYPGDLNGKSTIQNYFLPPHATLSRWANLKNAVSLFITEVDSQSYDAKIGLVTYSSTFNFGTFSSVASTTEQWLGTNYAAINTRLTAIGTKPLIGDTNIGQGMTDGQTVLLDTTRNRMTAIKTMILITDGIVTQGTDPAMVAQSLKTNRIVCHTISFGANADKALMANIAAITGGRYYDAPNSTALQAAFQDIALSLPSILTR